MSAENSSQKPKAGEGSALSRFAHNVVRQGVFKLPADPHDSPPGSPSEGESEYESGDESLTTSSVSCDDNTAPAGARIDREVRPRPDTDLSFWTTARGKQLEGRVMMALNELVLEKLAELEPSTVKYVVDRVLPELERIVAEVLEQEEEDQWVKCS